LKNFFLAAKDQHKTQKQNKGPGNISIIVFLSMSFMAEPFLLVILLNFHEIFSRNKKRNIERKSFCIE
jgi:hypothetical protein